MTAAPYRGGAPEAVADILKRVVRDVKPQARRGTVARTWAAAAGEELSGETRPASVKHGVLTVEVRSSALLAELEGFRKDELLARLLSQEPSGRITGLRFRVGVF